MPERKKSFKKDTIQIRSGILEQAALPRKDGNPSTLKPGAEKLYAVPAICGFLLLVVVLVFGQTLRHDFVNYDDDQYVYNNIHVAHGLTAQSIAWSMTARAVSNWHPLTWLSHMLDCQVYGLSPWGHHLTNVLLHAATAILLFLVLRRMTGDLWPSAFVAAVFAIHPLRVESVAWVAERKDVLSGLFFMLTLGAYTAYVQHPFCYTKGDSPNFADHRCATVPAKIGTVPLFSLARYLAVMVFFALGLMAKPMLVTLPLVLLLLDYWPLGRMTRVALENISVSGSRRSDHFAIFMRLALEKVPLLLLAAASCGATMWAQSAAIGSEHIPLGWRVGNAVVSYAVYIEQMFYPAGLAVLYPHPGLGLPMWKVAGAILLLAAVCAGVVVLRRRCPYLPVGWLWYLGMLMPVIGLVQVGAQATADRYTYLPQIGLYIAIAWGVAQVSRSWPYRGWLCGIASALVLAVLMGCAWRQTSFWRNSESLWTRALACTSRNYVAHYNLGLQLFNTGRLRDAIEHYQQAILINPNDYESHNNLGAALERLGQPQEAIEHFEKALKLNPDYPEAHNNLGNIMDKSGQSKKAIEHYRQSLQLNPNYSGAHYNLGNALNKAGNVQEAISHYLEAIRLNPDYVEAFANLASTYADAGRPSEAVSTAQKALDLARSKGQTALAKQIEDWLNSYRAGLSDLPTRPSSSNSAPQQP